MSQMRYIILIISVLFLFVKCATKPAIVRDLKPVVDKEYISATNNIAIISKDSIVIKVKYLNKIELRKLAEINNPYLEDDNTPLLTTFKIDIYNNREEKIEIDTKDAILLDGLGNQFNALTYSAFKELYPTTIYKDYQYSFIFNRYYVEERYTDDYYKRRKVAKTLFKGGIIYPQVHVTGILAFPRVSERARTIRLILPDIKIYKKDKDILTTFDVEIKFIQKIVRLKNGIGM